MKVSEFIWSIFFAAVAAISWRVAILFLMPEVNRDVVALTCAIVAMVVYAYLCTMCVSDRVKRLEELIDDATECEP